MSELSRRVLRSRMSADVDAYSLAAEVAALETRLEAVRAIAEVAVRAGAYPATVDMGEEILDALAVEAVRECERAIRQREESLRTGERTAEGGTHDTCFKHAFRNVLRTIGENQHMARNSIATTLLGRKVKFVECANPTLSRKRGTIVTVYTGDAHTVAPGKTLVDVELEDGSLQVGMTASMYSLLAKNGQ